MNRTILVARVFDKVALGGALAFFGLAVARPLLARPAELAWAERIVQQTATVEDYLATAPPLAPPSCPDPRPSLRARIDPLVVQRAEPFSPWLAHQRPSFIFELPPKPPELPEATHVAPTLAPLVVGHGRVTLSFASGPNDGVELVEREILRRELPDAGWRTLARLTPEILTYTDTAVVARTGYEYRVVERAKAAPGRKALPEDRSAAEVSSAPVETPRDFLVLLEDADLLERSLQVKVYRWDEAAQAFLPSKSFGVKEGGALTPSFPSRANGKNVTVVVETGAVVEDLTSVQRNGVPVPVAVVRWPTGHVDRVVRRETPGELRKP